MRIGVDCRQMINGSGYVYAGVGQYIYNITHKLDCLVSESDEFVFFIPEKYKSSEAVCYDNAFVIFIPEFVRKIPVWNQHIKMAKLLSKENLDVVLFPGHSIPMAYKGKKVLTIHDLAIYKHPEWFPDKQFFSKKVVLPHSLKKADKIIAVSEATKQDLIELFKVPKSKIEVVYEGNNIIDHKINVHQETLLNTKDYIFFVGTINPRKNLLRMIQAFESLKDNKEFAELYPDIEFWIAGAKGWKNEEVYNHINKSPWKKSIRFLGEVSEIEKIELIQKSRVLMYASLYEGFGLPIVEAMSLGTPVITSNISSMPEIAGEAALSIDPYDVHEIEKAIFKVLKNQTLREDLIQKGYIQSQKFNWEASAQQTLDVLKGCL